MRLILDIIIGLLLAAGMSLFLNPDFPYVEGLVEPERFTEVSR